MLIMHSLDVTDQIILNGDLNFHINTESHAKAMELMKLLCIFNAVATVKVKKSSNGRMSPYLNNSRVSEIKRIC